MSHLETLHALRDSSTLLPSGCGGGLGRRVKCDSDPCGPRDVKFMPSVADLRTLCIQRITKFA